MKELKVYSIDEKEIVDAFKKEGINVSYIDMDYDDEGECCLHPVAEEYEDNEKLEQLLCNCFDICNGEVEYVILKHILKIPYKKRTYMRSKAFCSDGNQKFMGDFNLLLVE